jgi:hypothetical protein
MATLGNFTAATLTAAELNAIGTWTTWTPTWTNLSVGNGTVTARYAQINKVVHLRLSLTFGSTTSVSGNVTFTLPVTASSTATIATHGVAQFNDASVPTAVAGVVRVASTTTAQFVVMDGASAWLTFFTLTASRPFASWATDDVMMATLTYEAA